MILIVDNSFFYTQKSQICIEASPRYESERHYNYIKYLKSSWILYIILLLTDMGEMILYGWFIDLKIWILEQHFHRYEFFFIMSAMIVYFIIDLALGTFGFGLLFLDVCVIETKCNLSWRCSISWSRFGSARSRRALPDRP